MTFLKTGNFHNGQEQNTSHKERVQNTLSFIRMPPKGELADVLIVLNDPSESKIKHYKEKNKLVMTSLEFLDYMRDCSPEYFL